MRKFVSILLAVAMCFSLAACGKNNDPVVENNEVETEEAVEESNTEEETSAAEEEEYDPVVDQIDLSFDEGNIKYVGFEPANAELTNYDNALIFKFAFTNYQNVPSQTQNVFRLQFFQNGAELDGGTSYSSAGGEQYNLVGAFMKEALKDGTVTFGKIVLPEDDNPITIIAKRNGGFGEDLYQMMEVDISKQSKDAGESDDNTQDVPSAEEVDEMLQGNWLLNGIHSFSFNDGNITVITEGVIMDGSYKVIQDDSVIEAKVQASNGTVSINIPYKFNNGELVILNNRDQELVKE